MTDDNSLIEQIVAQFELCRHEKDSRLEIETCLQKVPVSLRQELAARLIAADWKNRKESGQHPSPADYEGLGCDAVAIAESNYKENAEVPPLNIEQVTVIVEKNGVNCETVLAGCLEDNESDFLTNDRGPNEISNTRIGPYDLVRKLGEGGMGTVWMAEQLQPVRRFVALKVIKTGAGSKEILFRFEAERQALAMMNHPNIARILDAGTTAEGQPYFAMELVQGDTLTNYCDRNRLTINERLGLFIDICNGVQHAHQKGIVHRDLKPANIVVTVIDGVVVPKVIDFGLAKAMDSTQRLTDESLFTGIGQILGTLKYMSPEQASLDENDIDTRADIYALGVILYELIAGSTPMDDDSIRGQAVLKLLEFIREKEPVRPSSRLKHLGDSVNTITTARRTSAASLGHILTGDLDWVVMRALEKERGRRYQSVSSFIADVQRFLNSDPVEARPPSLDYRVRKFVRRNRAGVTAACLVMLALIAGIVSTAWGLRQAIAARGAEKFAREQESLQRIIADKRREQAERSEKIAVMERERSEKEKRVAESVRDFLRNSFLRQASVYEQANSTAEGQSSADVKHNVTVRELLDRAASKFSPEKIDSQFPGEPVVQFEILSTISDSYLACGEHDAAILFSRAARDVQEQHYGPAAPETIASIVELVFVYVTASRHADAIGEMQTVITRLEELLKIESTSISEDKETADAHSSSNMAGAAAIDAAIDAMVRRVDPLRFSYPSVSFQVYDGAIAMFRLGQSIPRLIRLAQITEEIYGADNRRTLFAKMLVGFSYHVLGQQQQAVVIYEDVLQLAEKGGQLDELILCGVWMMLSIAYDDLGVKPAESLQLTEQFYNVMHRRAGPDHPITLISMANLAESYDYNGEHDRALLMYEKVLAAQRERLGPAHPDTLNSLSNVASCYQDRKEFQKSLQLYEELVSARTAKLGTEHPETIDAMDSLASALVDTGDFVRALPLFEKTLELERIKFGSDHPSTLITMQNMAQALEKSGDIARALPLYKECADAQLAKKGPEHVDTLVSLGNLGTALMQLDRFQEAIPCLEPCVEKIETHAKLSVFRRLLRTCYHKANLAAEFEQMNAVDLKTLREKLAAGSADRAVALATFGGELLAIDAFAAAQPVLAESVEIYQTLGSDDWKRFHAELMLGESLMNQQKHPEAEPLLRSAVDGILRLRSSVSPDVRSVLPGRAVELLVQFYSSQNNLEAVKAWKARLDALQESSTAPGTSEASTVSDSPKSTD